MEFRIQVKLGLVELLLALVALGQQLPLLMVLTLSWRYHPILIR
jgi:hypothetical protein